MSWQLTRVRTIEDTWVEFKREIEGGKGYGSMDGETGKAREYRSLVMDQRGRVWLWVLGAKQSAKGAVAKRRKDLAHQALAYVSLNGSVEGFPLQTEI